MIAAGICFYFVPSNPGNLWIFGLALCIFVGPAQSASRTFLARIIPPGREGEVFGLYATTGRAVSFLAPAAFTLAVVIGESIHGRGHGTSFGILGIVLVLAVGLAVLVPVREDESRYSHHENAAH